MRSSANHKTDVLCRGRWAGESCEWSGLAPRGVWAATLSVGRVCVVVTGASSGWLSEPDGALLIGRNRQAYADAL